MSNAGNNTLFLDGSNPGIVGLAAGNDRYILSGTNLAANQKITISDSEGANTLQLVGGLAIASSRVSADAIELTLTNGAVVTVLNASTFTFLTGGDAFTGTGGLTQTYAQFVTVALGSTVPAAGATPVAVGPVTLVDPANVVVPVSSKLTVGEDTIIANAAGQTFTAPIVQNQLGAITNTLESGDVIAGMGMGNKLVADIAVSTIGLLPIGPAISAATNNVQVVELRAQTINLDLLGGVHPNFSNVDAENFNGVKQWWSVNSRSNLQVEDVRSRPEDTTIGMRNTDPEVSFFVYFDPEQLTDAVRAQDSAITLKLDDISDPGNLSGVPIDGLKFKLDGVSHTLRSPQMGNATTHVQFLAALKVELAKDAGLVGVTATLNPDNSITLEDPAGKTFATGSWSFINDDVPANGNIVFTQTVGDPLLLDVPIATNVLLDNVGRTSPGGDLDIGSLGDGGIAQFDVMVDRTSSLTRMESTSHLGNFVPVIQLNHLETVNFTSMGANGDGTGCQRGN